MQKQNIIGPTIRKVRLSKDITQLELSGLCKKEGFALSRSTIAKIESQIRKIAEVELYVMAKSLNVPIDDVFPANIKKALKSLPQYKA